MAPPEPPAPPLSAPAGAAWRAYRDAVRTGLPRAHVRAALDAFLAALGPDDRAPFAAWFLHERYDHDAPLDGQGSLVRLLADQLLVPELIAG